jgi:hypothetical protein
MFPPHFLSREKWWIFCQFKVVLLFFDGDAIYDAGLGCR